VKRLISLMGLIWGMNQLLGALRRSHLTKHINDGKGRFKVSKTWSDETTSGAPSPGLSLAGLSMVSAEEMVWEDRLKELLAMRLLHYDWDGMGATAPLPELTDTGVYLFDLVRQRHTLPPPSRIVASPCGSIIFEWQLDSFYLEAEITDLHHAEWMMETPDQPTEHWREEIESRHDTRTEASSAASDLVCALVT